MADARVRHPTLVLLAVLLIIVPLGLLAARALAFPVDSITVGAVIGGTLLVIGALALPALLLSGWQSERE